MFGWDSSAALSESSEIGFTRWLNHVFANGLATRHSLPTRLHTTGIDQGEGREEARVALASLLHSVAFSAPAHRIEREIDARKLQINSDLNFKSDKGTFTSFYDLATLYRGRICLASF